MLVITTPFRDTYKVNDKGQIIRTDMAFIPSDGWKFTGIRHVKKRLFIPFSELNNDLISTLDILYKNGNPQFTICDIDHGTERVWGNPKWHGIKSIHFEE